MDELQVQLRRVAEAFDGEPPPALQWQDRPTGATERRGPFLAAAALLVALLAFVAGAAMLGGGGADEPPPEPRRVERTEDGLRMILEVEDAVLPADETLRATLTVENVSDRPLLFGGIAGPADPTEALAIDAEPPAGLTATEVGLWERLTGFGVDLRPLGAEADGLPVGDDGYVELAPGATRRFDFEWDPDTQGPLFVGSGVVRVDPNRENRAGFEIPITLTDPGGEADPTSDTATLSSAAVAVLRQPQMVEYLDGATADDVLTISLDLEDDGWMAVIGNGSGSYAELVLDRETLETVSFEVVVSRPPTTEFGTG